MQEVYLLIGEILEVSQIIEYNLALVIKYNEYISKLKTKSKLVQSDFANFQKDVDKMYNSLLAGTLGQIVTKVKEIGIFSPPSVEKLYKVLNARNNIVHRFFKENNFNEIERFSAKYNDILAYLNSVLLNIRDINLKLCEIIKGQQIEFSNLYNEIKF